MSVLLVIKPSLEACQERNPSLPFLLPTGVPCQPWSHGGAAVGASRGGSSPRHPGLPSPGGKQSREAAGDPPLPGPL